MLKKIVLATANAGKIKEFQRLLTLPQIDFVSQSEFIFPQIQEDGMSFVENALIKARAVSQAAQLPAIADDSGLIVEALQGEPGIYSARYAGQEASNQENINKLLTKLKNIPIEKRQAKFYCTLVYLKYPTDPLPVISEAFWEGSILFQPQGKHGFGYDPIFYVPTHHCSAAELLPEEKARLSHRGQAVKWLQEKLLERND